MDGSWLYRSYILLLSLLLLLLLLLIVRGADNKLDEAVDEVARIRDNGGTIL